MLHDEKGELQRQLKQQRSEGLNDKDQLRLEM